MTLHEVTTLKTATPCNTNPVSDQLYLVCLVQCAVQQDDVVHVKHPQVFRSCLHYFLPSQVRVKCLDHLHVQTFEAQLAELLDLLTLCCTTRSIFLQDDHDIGCNNISCFDMLFLPSGHAEDGLVIEQVADHGNHHFPPFGGKDIQQIKPHKHQ